jgi:hypothetical protein
MKNWQDIESQPDYLPNPKFNQETKLCQILADHFPNDQGQVKEKVFN